MKKVAVTGGLASGKTSVCLIFKSLGAYVVNADAIVHRLLSSDIEIRTQIVRELGPDVIKQGILDRDEIAKKVFSQAERRIFLEQLIHPAVIREIETQYQNAKTKHIDDLFVVEIPLLYEIKQDSFYDVVIAVVADREACLHRFCKTPGKSPREFEQRMAAQLSMQEKAVKADFTIVNNGTLEELKEQVIQLKEMLSK